MAGHPLRPVLVAWALPILADSGHHGQATLRGVAMPVLAAMLLAWPRVGVLLALAAVDLVLSPLVPFSDWLVHHYITFTMSASVWMATLAVAFHRRRVPEESELLSLLRPMGLVLTAAVIFTGLAKINADYLDPITSCGTVYYLWFTEFPVIGGLVPTAPWARFGAVWGVVVLEIAGPLLVLVPATRRVGLVLIWMLVALLAANPRSLYFEFIGLFWVGSLLCLPPGTLTRVSEALPQLSRRPIVRAALVAVALALVGLTQATDKLDWPWYTWRYTGVLGALGMGVLALRHWQHPLSPPRLPTRWRALVWIPGLLLMLNELSVYAGLVHTPALWMASNAQMRRSRSNNHVVDLIGRRLPPLPGGRDMRVLFVVGVPGLEMNDHVEEVTLRHLLVDRPDAKVVVLVEGSPDALHLDTPEQVAAFARSSPLVPLLGLTPHRRFTGLAFCEKREPKKTLEETHDGMRRALLDRGGR